MGSSGGRFMGSVGESPISPRPANKFGLISSICCSTSPLTPEVVLLVDWMYGMKSEPWRSTALYARSINADGESWYVGKNVNAVVEPSCWSVQAISSRVTVEPSTGRSFCAIAL